MTFHSVNLCQLLDTFFLAIWLLERIEAKKGQMLCKRFLSELGDV